MATRSSNSWAKELTALSWAWQLDSWSSPHLHLLCKSLYSPSLLATHQDSCCDPWARLFSNTLFYQLSSPTVSYTELTLCLKTLTTQPMHTIILSEDSSSSACCPYFIATWSHANILSLRSDIYLPWVRLLQCYSSFNALINISSSNLLFMLKSLIILPPILKIDCFSPLPVPWVQTEPLVLIIPSELSVQAYPEHVAWPADSCQHTSGCPSWYQRAAKVSSSASSNGASQNRHPHRPWKDTDLFRTIFLWRHLQQISKAHGTALRQEFQNSSYTSSYIALKEEWPAGRGRWLSPIYSALVRPHLE